jgi:hypothetical protein
VEVRHALLFAALAVTSTAGAENFRDAVVVDAGAYTETGGAVLIGNVAYPATANMNAITVQIDGMLVTAVYETWVANGKNAAGAFVIGNTVQARLSGKRSQWLEVRVPGGSVVKASVTRRERVDIVEGAQ